MDPNKLTTRRTPTVAHVFPLPVDITIVDVITAMMAAGPTGRILNAKLYPPDKNHPDHSAALIEFNSFPEANRLLRLGKDSKFHVKGVVPVVKLQLKGNQPEAALDHGPGRTPLDPAAAPKNLPSRVLVIKGRVADPRLQVFSLHSLFERHRIPLGTEHVVEKDNYDNSTRKVTWRFCSWRHQAAPALVALRKAWGRNTEALEDRIVTYYGNDPCDVGMLTEASRLKLREERLQDASEDLSTGIRRMWGEKQTKGVRLRRLRVPAQHPTPDLQSTGSGTVRVPQKSPPGPEGTKSGQLRVRAVGIKLRAKTTRKLGVERHRVSSVVEIRPPRRVREKLPRTLQITDSSTTGTERVLEISRTVQIPDTSTTGKMTEDR